MIELAKANPDIETLKLTLIIASALIAFLLAGVMALISYLTKKQIKVSEDLTLAVNQLTTAVSILESQNNILHPVIERRLNDHGGRLDQHDREIVCIKTKLRMNTNEKS